ncbi:MAG: DUF924 family protein [Pontixanthobacter sp.]
MSVVPIPWMADLLHVWFDRLKPSDWFGSSEDIDLLLRQHFGDILPAMSRRPATAFLSSPDTAIAAILLFDQIPRNIHRGTRQAFAYDGVAVRLAKGAIARGFDTWLPRDYRQFMAMPLMHSEDRADQAASVAYFGRHLPGNLPFARSHRAMIARFGRFPHRNAVLGRTSTPAERAAIDAGFRW